MTGNARHSHAPTGSAEQDGAAASRAGAAKWVIPSVGALVAILGFVVEAAHQSMLGVDFGDLGARAYLWSFGQFLRETTAGLANALFLRGFFAVPGVEELLLVLAAVLTVLVLLRRRLGAAGRAGWWTDRPNWPLAALVLMALLRLWYVDLPISRVENVLARGSDSMAHKLDVADRSGLETPLLEKARNYYSLIICSRPISSASDAGIACKGSREAYAGAITRLLLGSVLMSIMLLIVALRLLPFVGNGIGAFVLAPLAIYTAIAPAYVYGKFGKSTVYDTALVQVKTDLDAMPAVKPVIDGKLAKAPGAAAGAKEPAKLLSAVLLARDEKFLSLYVNQPVSCGGNKQLYQWVPWRVATGEVVVIREITPTDVIVLRAEQDSCPKSPPPP